jgi:hypothetical protein
VGSTSDAMAAGSILTADDSLSTPPILKVSRPTARPAKPRNSAEKLPSTCVPTNAASASLRFSSRRPVRSSEASSAGPRLGLSVMSGRCQRLRRTAKRHFDLVGADTRRRLHVEFRLDCGGFEKSMVPASLML